MFITVRRREFIEYSCKNIFIVLVDRYQYIIINTINKLFQRQQCDTYNGSLRSHNSPLNGFMLIVLPALDVEGVNPVVF